MRSLACVSLLTTVFALAQSTADAQVLTSLNKEKTGTQLDVKIDRTGLIFGGGTELRMDVDYVYRASTLMGEPVLNCGVRIRNISGTVTLEYDGKVHSVEVGAENSQLINIHHVDLLARYTIPGGLGHFVACNAGVPAREGTEPFNVASSPSWSSTFCDGHRKSADLPDRLGPDWCWNRNGQYLEAPASRDIFSKDWQHSAATIEVAALSVSVNDLLVAETARLHEAAEAKARTEADNEAEAEAARLASEAVAEQLEKAAASAEDERKQKSASSWGASDRVKSMLDRLASKRPDTPAPIDGDKKDPIAAMAARVAAARAEQAIAQAREEAARAKAEEERLAREKAEAEAAKRVAAEAAQREAKEREALAKASLTRFEFSKGSPSGCPVSRGGYGGVGYRDATERCIAGGFYKGSEFSEGFAVVNDGMNTEESYRFIDATGKYRFKAYRWALGFNDGFALVYTGKVARFIDREGKERFEDYFPASTGSFALGVAPIQRVHDGEMIYIDTSGRDASLGKFQYAESFDKMTKLAIVKASGKYGAIDRNGRTAIPFNYYSLIAGTDDANSAYFEAATTEARKIGSSCGKETFSTTYIHLDTSGRQIKGSFEKEHEKGTGLCLRSN